MADQKLSNVRVLLTAALLLNTIAWFIPDMFFPDSHFNSTVWHLHARMHVGSSATVNFVYIILGIWLIWRSRFDLRYSMQLVAGAMAVWNITVILFFLLALPFLMGPDDTYISWSLEAKGAGNAPGTGIEGAVFPMAGIPALMFLHVLWKLRN